MINISGLLRLHHRLQGGGGSRTKKENLRGFILWVLSYEPQGTGERSGPHYFIFPLLCSLSQWTILLAYWSWIAERRCFYIHPDKFQRENVRLSRNNLMDYFCKLSVETEASCGSLIFHTPSDLLFFFPTEPLTTCLTGMRQTQLALFWLTNSFVPRQVCRKLLCAAYNGESLFFLLIRLRDWALASHNCIEVLCASNFSVTQS